MDPSPDRMHRPTAETDAALRAIADATLERLANPPGLGGPLTPDELSAAVGETISAAGLGAQEALRLWVDMLAPACIASDHPRYLGFIPAAPSRLAGAFDMIVGASSIYGGSWLEGSGAAYAENQTLRWIADLAGFPEPAGGSFVQGGTIGNLSALVTAREHTRHQRSIAGRAAPARWAVCLTEETHSSVAHSLRTVMDVDVIRVPVDERGRLTGAALETTVAALDADARDGVFAVVANAGSTNLGIVDDLTGAADVAGANGWWLHVDGAYGGAGLAAPSARALFAGIERADSFIVDPHKWFFGTFDCCALLYREPSLARAAHTQHADYLEVLNSHGAWNPSDYSIQLSRRARGLPMWYSLASHGADAYRDAIESTLTVTRAGADMIRDAEHLELLVEPELGILVFERLGWSDADYDAWAGRLLHDQLAFVANTRHHGRVCARLAIVNPLTTTDIIQTVLDTMATNP